MAGTPAQDNRSCETLFALYLVETPQTNVCSIRLPPVYIAIHSIVWAPPPPRTFFMLNRLAGAAGVAQPLRAQQPPPKRSLPLVIV
jgi:hypothetical protein